MEQSEWDELMSKDITPVRRAELIIKTENEDEHPDRYDDDCYRHDCMTSGYR